MRHEGLKGHFFLGLVPEMAAGFFFGGGGSSAESGEVKVGMSPQNGCDRAS